MDNPNLIENFSSDSFDQMDKMTSVSQSKRTIVLGVVNTSGMKSANLNKKRRWDQPPEESSEIPCAKKVRTCEETESLDFINKADAQWDIPEPQQSDYVNSIEPEDELEHLTKNISNEASAMSVDLPNEESEKSPQPIADINDEKLCSDLNDVNCEVQSTVISDVSTGVCEKQVNSLCSESSIKTEDVPHQNEVAVKRVFENKVNTVKEKKKVSTATISHESEELRRIMFSYDESSSESYVSECSSPNPQIGIATEVVRSEKSNLNENISEDSQSIELNQAEEQQTLVEESPCPEKRFTEIKLHEEIMVASIEVIREKDQILKFPGPPCLESRTLLATESGSQEKDAFTTYNESSSNLSSVSEKRPIESQLNIPIHSEYDSSNNIERVEEEHESVKSTSESDRESQGFVSCENTSDSMLSTVEKLNEENVYNPSTEPMKETEASLPSAASKNECLDRKIRLPNQSEPETTMTSESTSEYVENKLETAHHHLVNEKVQEPTISPHLDHPLPSVPLIIEACVDKPTSNNNENELKVIIGDSINSKCLEESEDVGSSKVCSEMKLPAENSDLKNKVLPVNVDMDSTHSKLQNNIESKSENECASEKYKKTDVGDLVKNLIPQAIISNNLQQTENIPQLKITENISTASSELNNQLNIIISTGIENSSEGVELEVESGKEDLDQDKLDMGKTEVLSVSQSVNNAKEIDLLSNEQNIETQELFAEATQFEKPIETLSSNVLDLQKQESCDSTEMSSKVSTDHKYIETSVLKADENNAPVQLDTSFSLSQTANVENMELAEPLEDISLHVAKSSESILASTKTSEKDIDMENSVSVVLAVEEGTQIKCSVSASGSPDLNITPTSKERPDTQSGLCSSAVENITFVTEITKHIPEDDIYIQKNVVTDVEIELVSSDVCKVSQVSLVQPSCEDVSMETSKSKGFSFDVLEDESSTIDVEPTSNIDLSVMEVIFGSDDKSSIVNTEIEDNFIEQDESEGSNDSLNKIVSSVESKVNEDENKDDLLLADSEDFTDKHSEIASAIENIPPAEGHDDLCDEDSQHSNKSLEVELSSKLEIPNDINAEIEYEQTVDTIIEDESKTLTEDIDSFVVEEVVTSESPEVEGDSDNELDKIIDNANNDPSSLSQDETSEEVGESIEVDQFETVIACDNVELELSTIDNQNEVLIESEIVVEECISSESLDSNKDSQNETETQKNEMSDVEMECESAVNSIINAKSPYLEEMEVDEPPTADISSRTNPAESNSIKPGLLTVSSVLNPIKEHSALKDANTGTVPLLKTVPSSEVPKKLAGVKSEELEKSGSISQTSEIITNRLEPITLRIYKDNLSIKTDELDSPKKNKSPKLTSELKSQLSPHVRSESRSSSPQTKQLEFTLKIAKDANTNIPRATMSPKSNMSPVGGGATWKTGEVLRSELSKGQSSPAPSSPRSPAEHNVNSLKLKISKPASPASPNELVVTRVSKGKKSNALNKEEPKFGKEKLKGKRDNTKEDSTTLPKQAIEIGSALKKIMDKEVKIESPILEEALHSNSNPETPSSPAAKKRGRPRKLINSLSIENTDLNPRNPPPSPPKPETLSSASRSPVGGGGGELSPGEASEASNRQVRSCRSRTQPIVPVKPRKPKAGPANKVAENKRGRGVGPGGAKGVARPISTTEEAEKLAEKLSQHEKAELAKIEARKEKLRLDRIAKNDAKKAKKLAKKLKDEERRKRLAREKAEKAEAAAPQVFEEETRMSAPDSRGHTPAPAPPRATLQSPSDVQEESQNSISMSNTPSSSANKKGRMEIPLDYDCSKDVTVDQLAEYQWQGSELFMIQEQVSSYLGVKSFKRKYPDLRRRPVEAEERTFLEDSGLVPKALCDLGLTAVSSAEVLDIMFQDFPDKYEEFRKFVRDKQAKEQAFKQKALFASMRGTDKSKGEPREQALEAAALWNSNLNRERREDRRCSLDLQTFTVHYPKNARDRMARPLPKLGHYPVAVIPGQFTDFYKPYTPTELMYYPLNTVMYGPLKPNERRPCGSSDSSSSSDSSDSSSDSDSGDEEGVNRECKICNGEKKTASETHPEILLQCSQCKGLCHPTCQEITPEMLPHIKKYNWHCSNCKKCMQCKNTTKEDKMLFCDLCDRGYHLHCVGLKKSPEGRWHCSVCSFCTSCGSKDPGGPGWHYEYKKTDKGVRLYQRTLCVPCGKNALM